MEEAVTRKFVHEDSSHIISFCGEWWPRWRPRKRWQWGAASWVGCGGAMYLGASSCFMMSFVTLELHSAGGSGFGNAELWEKG